jgi:hypothetical protein
VIKKEVVVNAAAVQDIRGCSKRGEIRASLFRKVSWVCRLRGLFVNGIRQKRYIIGVCRREKLW